MGYGKTAKAAGVTKRAVAKQKKRGVPDGQIIVAAKSRSASKVVHTVMISDGEYVQDVRRKEKAIADLRELELAEKRRELLNAGEVSTAIHELISASKSKLMLIGDELGDRLAAEADPIRCRELIAAEVRNALTELSQYQVA